MGRRRLTDAEIESWRSQALEAAERLFAEKGDAGITLRAIANELGCSTMTTYRYFRDREELLSTLRAAVFARFSAELGAASAAAPGPLDAVDALRVAYVEFALREPDSYRLMFSLRPPERPHPELERWSQMSFSHLHTAVAEAVETGRLSGDPLTRAHLIWAELHGLVSLHVSRKLNFGRSVRELVRVSHWRSPYED